MKKRTNRICYAMLLVFLVAGWVVSSNRAMPDVLSTSLAALVNIGGILSCPFVLFIAFLYRPDRGRALSPRMGKYLLAWLILTVSLTLYGVLAGNSLRVVVLDLLAMAPLLGGLVLGTDDEVWNLITPPVFFLTTAAIIISIAFTDSRILEDRSIINHETGTAFETLLTVLPVIATVHACRRRSNWYYPSILGCLGILFVYLYFGRRGISLRATLEIIVASLVAPILSRFSTRAFASCVAVFVFAIGLLLYFPFDLLMGRYRGENGVVSTVTTDNERWFEGEILLRELSATELFVGRGIGGAYSVDTDNGYFLDVIEGDRTGKVGTHMGALWPVLKGGSIFCFLYFLPCFFLFRGLGSVRELDPITRGVVLIAPVWFAFQFIDGSISYSQPWMGFGTGLILSRFDRIAVNNRFAFMPAPRVVPDSRPLDFPAPARAAR